MLPPPQPDPSQVTRARLAYLGGLVLATFYMIFMQEIFAASWYLEREGAWLLFFTPYLAFFAVSVVLLRAEKRRGDAGYAAHAKAFAQFFLTIFILGGTCAALTLPRALFN